ncbi:hypothetical protein MKX08_009797 [Trichoderma sp. CBMAI-0020]|nr:hypothetical protein MKX08_009797 [Trichoderma sp. CBMAI-0020]
MAGKLAVYEACRRKYDFIDERNGDEKNKTEDSLEGETDLKVSILERARTHFRTLKLNFYDWLIFDKKRLVAVEDYKSDTDSLPDFAEIEGEFAEGVAAERFQLGRWSHRGSQHSESRASRIRRQLRSDDLDEYEIAKLKKPVKTLAWLLQNPSFRGTGEESSEEQPVTYSLQCLGYEDDVKAKRMSWPPDGTDDNMTVEARWRLYTS